MSRDLKELFGLDKPITTTLKPSYDFSHVATYRDNTPHSVVFQDELGQHLKIPASHFEMGDYKEWKDPEVLSTREVMRAAGHLAMYR